MEKRLIFELNNLLKTLHCFVIFILYYELEELILLQIIRQFKKVKVGVDTWLDFFAYCLQSIIYKATHKCCWIYDRVRLKRFKSKFYNKKKKEFIIKDIKFPNMDADNEIHFPEVFDDTLSSYYYLEDSYDEFTFDKCDEYLCEGLYGFINDRVNVTVKPGDIVIDAGSWIGDFAAYASLKVGIYGKIFAFEPTDKTFKYLEQTASLNNNNIIPLKKGLSNENKTISLYMDVFGHSLGNTMMNKESSKDYVKSSNTVEVIRLDDFVRENNLSHVDFIKADIEGFERYMLEGAQETLRKFAPKLAICTYHLPDDPEVIAALIKKANPAYNIVQKRKKLFASVPK